MRNLLLLTLVNLLWALQFPASRVAAQELGPLTLTWTAMLLATVLLLPLAWSERRGKFRRVGRPRRLRMTLSVVVLGIAGSLIAQLCLNWGLERSPAANASVLNLSIPVLMALLAAALLDERMSPLRWAAFAISIAGVLLASDIDWSSTSLLDNRHLTGNGLILLSCGGSAFYNVFSKRLLEWFGAAELLVASFAVSLGVLLPPLLALEPGAIGRLQSASTASLVSVVTIGALSLALSMVLFFRVLGEIDATQASLSIYLLPVFGVALSALALRERVRPALVAGGLLVAAGAWLVTGVEDRQNRRKAATASASD